MNIRAIVGCEKSGIIRDALISVGVNAISCDLQDTERPGPHIKGNLLDHLNDGWDLGIFHPECKFLCFSGERWIKERPGRYELRLAAFEFFKKCYNANIPRVGVESSHSVFLNKHFGMPTQSIHPYHFGDPFKKLTCLWIRGLPPLIPTNILPIGQRHPACWLERPGPNRSENRARTYPGIATAIAEQWGKLLLNN